MGPLPFSTAFSHGRPAPSLTSLGPITICAKLVPIHMLAPMMCSHRANVAQGPSPSGGRGEANCPGGSERRSPRASRSVSGTIGSRTAWTWPTAGGLDDPKMANDLIAVPVQGTASGAAAGSAAETDVERHRLGDLLRGPTGLPAGSIDRRDQRSHALGVVVEVRVPRVPGRDIRQGQSQHPGPVGADQEGRASRTGRPGKQLTVDQGVELAPVVDATFAQQGPNNRESLGEPGEPPVVGQPECFEFDLVPTGSDPEDEPAPADFVDRRCLLRQHRRVVKRERRHQRARVRCAR